MNNTHCLWFPYSSSNDTVIELQPAPGENQNDMNDLLDQNFIPPHKSVRIEEN